ncbi:hypothetical protein HAX54_047389 [Datura stramonium]|uniref:WIYLD domain-containing protein n=1 Tax=Datura stramonium TaxID=4076 RepID=A0ABS8WI63_DATST|nr:hypothetical protein [Datura stramonium]
MAPRGRTKKRLTRMDAAVDAMAPLGFDKRLVKITVKKLLKEYGGDELWPFIEEYSYKELIEAILRAQEEEQTETQKGVSSQDERVEDPALGSTIDPSGTLVDSTCNEQSTFSAGTLVDSACNEQSTFPSGTLVDTTCNEQSTFPSGTLVDTTCNEQSAIGPSGTLVISTCDEAGNTVGETYCSEPVNAVEEPADKEFCSNKQDSGSSEEFCPLPAEGGRNRWKDIEEDQPSIQKGMANAACSDGGNSVNQVQPGSKSHVFAQLPTSIPCAVNQLKICSESRVLQAGSNSHVATPPSTSSPRPVNRLKMCSGSQVQSRRNSHVSPPRSTASSCQVSVPKMSSGTQSHSPRNSHVSTPPPTSSACRVSNLKMSSGSQVKSPRNCHVSAPPPTSSLCRVSNLKMSSGSQEQSRSISHVSTPPPTYSCTVNNLPPPADHRPTTLPSSKPASTQPPRRRFPCYGWIENDDEEDADDFMQLQPMKPTTSLQSQSSSVGSTKCMKRKSRWDV